MARYGSPKYVVIRDWDTGTVSVDLTYPENGLVIELTLHDLGKEPDNIKVNIMAKQEVADIYFYAPGLEHYYADPSVRQPLKQYDWKGYTSYP